MGRTRKITSVVTAAAAGAALLAGVVPARAGEVSPPAVADPGLPASLPLPGGDEPREQPRHRDERGEQLRLACRGAARDGEAAVGCRWSEARHPRFAAYRLWRAQRDERPAVVHVSRERGETWAVDRDVEVGEEYYYLLEVVDGSGDTIGRSNVARAVAGDQPTTQSAAHAGRR